MGEVEVGEGCCDCLLSAPGEKRRWKIEEEEEEESEEDGGGWRCGQKDENV